MRRNHRRKRAVRSAVETLEGRTMLAVSAVSPLNGAVNVSASANVTVTFDVAMNASTINSSTLQLRDQNNAIIPATVTYNASTRVATIDPTPSFAAGAYVYARVLGGSSGVKTSTGAAHPNDFNWAFTTGTPTFTESSVFTGLTAPTAVEFSPDGRVFVAEKRGIIKVFDSLTDPQPDIFADLRTSVHNYWDRGLLGLALHPQFPTVPYVYVLYTYDAPIGGTAPAWGTPNTDSDPGPGTTGNGPAVSGRLSRLTASGNVSTGETVLINDWGQQYPSHSIGHLQFGPDGYLYASGGDGASFSGVDYGQINLLNDPVNEGGAVRSQSIRSTANATSLDGTIIRIDPNTGAGAPGNPLTGNANRQRVIAYGLRNPFRFNFRPGTNEIWTGDVGWNDWEEINRITNISDSAVENFGWPAYEGPNRQSGYDNANLPLLESLYAAGTSAHNTPYYAYLHSAKVVSGSSEPTGGSSQTGIAFYNGGSYPQAFDGSLFFADYSRKQIYVMFRGVNGLPDTNNRQIMKSTTNGAVELQIGPGGDLFYVDMTGGRIQRFTYSAGANRAPTAVISADRTTGAAPLTVNFNGGGSSDPDAGDVLTYAWDLDGDGNFNDSTAVAPAYTYTTNGAYTARLRVTDRAGLSSTASLLISVGNTAPVPVINTPTTALRWKVGDSISFSGSATDNEDGTLAASRLSWEVVLMHDSEINPGNPHEHSIQSFNGVASGAFTAIDHEYPSWLELRLTATDSNGLSATVSRRLDPQTVVLNFATSPSGLQITHNSGTFTAPFSRTVIVGSVNTIIAFTQTSGGQTYQFASWSDGGAATHQITAPASSATYTATYTTSASPPAAPDGLAAVVVTGNRVDLSWTDNSNNETSFVIERRYAGWIWETLATVGANVTAHSDTTAIANVTYEYRVKAVNSAGSSAYSAGLIVNTGQITPGGVPAAPANLAAVALSQTRVQLNWTDNSTNETGFKVQRRVQGQSTWNTIVTTAANVVTYDDTSVAANTTYEYRVLATNATGDSSPSNTATATTAASSIPAAPTNLVGVFQSGSGSVKLDWTDNSSNESGFQIERRYAGWIWGVIGTVAANVRTYSDTTAIGNVTYEYRVAATSTGGLSPYSNGVLIVTSPGVVQFGEQTTGTQQIQRGALPAGSSTASAPLFSTQPIIRELAI